MRVYECKIPVEMGNGYTSGVVDVTGYVVAHGPLIARTTFREYAYNEYGDDIIGGVVSREVIPDSDLPTGLLPNGLILPAWLLDALWQDAQAIGGEDD